MHGHISEHDEWSRRMTQWYFEGGLMLTVVKKNVRCLLWWVYLSFAKLSQTHMNFDKGNNYSQCITIYMQFWDTHISSRFQVQVQVLYFPKEYKWSYTFQKHIEYIQVSMGRKAEKAMLISLLTSGELKKYTQKNARYMKHKKLENIFTQTLLRTHSLYANMNTYSMYHNHIF